MQKFDAFVCHAAVGALIAFLAHVRLGLQPRRQSWYHACIWSRIFLGNSPSALVPTPFDDKADGCFERSFDWALAPLQLRSNKSATTGGNVRMGYRRGQLLERRRPCGAISAARIGANTEPRRVFRLSLERGYRGGSRRVCCGRGSPAGEASCRASCDPSPSNVWFATLAMPARRSSSHSEPSHGNRG